MRQRRHLTVSIAAAALVAAVALPAGAHPAFTGGATAPANTLTGLTLEIAHGCASEDLVDSEPTVEVAVEVPDAFVHIEPLDAEGYQAGTEGGSGDVPDVVTWTATDGGAAAPVLPMEVIVDGDPGDEVYVRVIQRCEESLYRWAGTPDDPADHPAVLLTLTDPDPDAPLVEEPAPDEPAPGEAAGEERGTGEAPEAGEAEGDEPTTTVEDLPTEPPGDDRVGGVPWPLIVLGAVVVAALGALLGARGRPVLDPTARGDDSVFPDGEDV
jgi:uncharacterized protein YcnI